MVETSYHVPACPVTAALLADTHNQNMETVLESLRRRPPELILLAGDFLYAAPPAAPGRLKMQESRNALELLGACAALAPTFVSLGNHEWMLNEQDLALLADTGAVVLDNRFVSLSIGGDKLCVGGLTSARLTAYQTWRGKQPLAFLYPEPDRSVWAGKPEPNLDWLRNFERQEGYKILLCHHPEYVPRYLNARNIDLILSGHAHGGQIQIAGHGLYAPGQGLFPKLTHGLYDGEKLLVSRGMTNGAKPRIPRIGNPCELIILNLVSTSGTGK